MVMRPAALQVYDLAFGYPSRIIGAGFRFSLAPGEVVCVLGPNGCGKTTLFRTILGLLPPKAGDILVEGMPIKRWRRNALARAMGYVPQAHSGYFAFTVREIVLMGRTAQLPLFGTPGRRDHEAAERIMAMLGIDHLAERVYTQVSGGERQLALIGRALAQEPKLLVLDEPTANLDFGNQLLVLAQMRALAREGIGILFSTHDPDQAFICADRVLMLRDGLILCQGPPAEVITSENLYRVYGVQVQVVDVVVAPGETRKTCVPSLARRDPAPTSRGTLHQGMA
jgi:iron complex transport system ATP-binding protein